MKRDFFFMNWKTLKFLCGLMLSATALHFCSGMVQAADQPAIVQRTFASPTEATSELVKAAKAHDRQAIHQIFGPEITNLMTGDQTLDEKHFEAFANELTERCEATADGSNRVTLEIGTNTWPFPIPLVQTNGAWIFDTLAGEDEIVNRHIGRDEFYAIGVCRAYVKAQREYAARFTQPDGTTKYAEKLKSSAGKMDGLYWETATNDQPSPLSVFVAESSLDSYNWKNGKGPRPFHGYLFKILTRQGLSAPGGKVNYIQHGGMTAGFALIAYPVRWGESGVMTFIVDQDGIVYQRSLGENTSKLAGAMKEYNPTREWTQVQEPGISDLTEDSADKTR